MRPIPLAFAAYGGPLGSADAAAAAIVAARLQDAHANRLLQQERDRLLLLERQAQAAFAGYSQMLNSGIVRPPAFSGLGPGSPFLGAPSAASAAFVSVSPSQATSALSGASSNALKESEPEEDKKPRAADAKPTKSHIRSPSGADSPSSAESNRFPSEREAIESDVLGTATEDLLPSPKAAERILKALGTTLRSKADKFVDVSRFPHQENDPNEKRRGASVFFPEILYGLLEENGESNVVSWLPHNRAFRVHNKHLFEKEILPRYFMGQTKVCLAE
jgi:hypothetical protein